MRQFFLLVVTGLVLFAANALFSTELAAPGAVKESFVDLDGDGFDDNLVDSDANGIPDELTNGDQSSDSVKVSEGSDMFAGLSLVSARVPIFLHNSGFFNHLKKSLLTLTQFRSGIAGGTGFGPGCDIGSGAVLGGACAGGACGPR